MKDHNHWTKRYWQLTNEIKTQPSLTPEYIRRESAWEQLIREIQQDASGYVPPPPAAPLTPVTDKNKAKVLLQITGIGNNQVSWHNSLSHALAFAQQNVTNAGLASRPETIIITRPRLNIHFNS